MTSPLSHQFIYLLIAIVFPLLIACKKEVQVIEVPGEEVIATYDNYEGYWVVLYKERIKDG